MGFILIIGGGPVDIIAILSWWSLSNSNLSCTMNIHMITNACLTIVVLLFQYDKKLEIAAFYMEWNNHLMT